MERLYLSSGVRLEWKGLDPTDEGQRKKAAKSLLGRVNWKGTYQSSCDLAATRTEQFCEEMNVFLSIIGNDTVKDKNVTVNVTDKTMKKKAEISRRQGSILSLIEINDRITFDEITSKFTVSRRTIARDIASLKKNRNPSSGRFRQNRFLAHRKDSKITLSLGCPEGLLAAGGKGGVSIGGGGGGSNNELTNWDCTKKSSGWSRSR